MNCSPGAERSETATGATRLRPRRIRTTTRQNLVLKTRFSRSKYTTGLLQSSYESKLERLSKWSAKWHTLLACSPTCFGPKRGSYTVKRYATLVASLPTPTAPKMSKFHRRGSKWHERLARDRGDAKDHELEARATSEKKFQASDHSVSRRINYKQPSHQSTIDNRQSSIP